MPAAWVSAGVGLLSATGAFGGGSGGGGDGGGGGGSVPSNGIPLSLLAQIVGQGSALNDLFGSGPNSLSGMTQTAASASDPFAAQRAQYQQQLATGTAQGQTIASNTASGGAGWGASQLATLAGQNQISPGLNANTAKATLDPNIAALTNPTAAQDFEYQKGLDAMTRSAAQGGYVGSGRQMLEAQQYGQQSASQFLQQDFNNAVTAQGVANSTQQQNYAQMLGTTQNNQTAQLNQFNETQGLFNSGLAQSQLAGNQQNAVNQQLLTSSGAATGSPATSGTILAGKYGNQQTALLQLLQSVQGGSGQSLSTLGQGASAIGQGLGNLVNGVGNWFNGNFTDVATGFNGADYGTALNDSFQNGSSMSDFTTYGGA